MERCTTTTTDPQILTLPTLGEWRLACVVASKDAGWWVCHWERIG